MRKRRPLDLEFLQRGPTIKAGRVKVLVAFGDLTGFSSWTRRGSNSPEEFRDFMVHLYKEFIRFRNGNGYFVKLMGDGFMCVAEIDKANGKNQALDFLRHSMELVSSVRDLTKHTFPTPGPFRVRITAGHVWKMMAHRTGQRASTQTDYLGYPVNLAARLLEIERESAILCHESVVKMTSKLMPKEMGFSLRKMRVRGRCPLGVDPEDIQDLWTVKSD